MEDNFDEKAARKQVRRLRHLYKHALTYGAVIVFLHIVNLITSDTYWAFWPAFGWGIALALHAITTLELMPVFGREWEEKKVQEILAKRSR
jgi:2TM domain-containing protein